jgi:beta-galactosidase
MNRRELLIGTGLLGAHLLLPRGVEAKPRKSLLTASDNQFMRDGKPVQILAGEMHYPRIPRGSWRDRMRKLKALGLNTLSTYVFWNAHEPEPGHYDFSGNLDLAAYIRLAQEEGLTVNLRPGPYVCAEWDGGGFPAWLTPAPDVQVRSIDPRFMEPVRRWMMRLGRELRPLFAERGGPIALTQIENEYGAFGSDQAYLRAQEAILRAAGFGGLYYTADPGEHVGRGSIPGRVAGVNFGTWEKARDAFAKRAAFRPEGPYFNPEIWAGWFDAWGKTHASARIEPLVDSLRWMLEQKYSFSLYMLHGGTNFGFTAGANWNKEGYQPDITSYDYDSPIDEAGRPTPKYQAIRKMMAEHLPATAFGPMPKPQPVIEIPPFQLRESASIYQLLGRPEVRPDPVSIDELGQSHGMMLYRHRPQQQLRGRLSFDDVRDYAVLGNGAVIDRMFDQKSADIFVPAGGNVDLLVDSMGHCNYGDKIGKDQKGLIGRATLDGAALQGWEHYRLPLDDLASLHFGLARVPGPAFYRGSFEISDPGFTFLDMRRWGRGYVWVNGHNLGRYWSAGPQGALFVPGEWLHAGKNEVIVLDLHAGGQRMIRGVKTQIWDLSGNG